MNRQFHSLSENVFNSLFKQPSMKRRNQFPLYVKLLTQFHGSRFKVQGARQKFILYDVFIINRKPCAVYRIYFA